jgi:uncharacterized protein (TIGR03066 family)
LVLAGFASAADEKIDAKKLLGKWELAKPDPKAPKMVLEIMDKGKFTMTVELNGKSNKVDGTYKVDGNKIEIEMNIGGNVMKDTLTITKLTDTEMVSKDSKGMVETLKRVK